MRVITRTVWILSLVSLFTDIASEMLYPVMPVYLESIHFSVLLIGILEGMAEAVAGFSKGYFGKLSDNVGRRLPFVRLGYSLSAISKPLMAVSTFPLWVFIARSFDRLGKGIRTGARDAMLSSETTTVTKATVFGFHRAMDTTGAVLGPLSALIFLYYHPAKYQALFLIAFIPGILAIGLTFLAKEKRSQNSTAKPYTSFFSFLHYWKSSSAAYRKLVTGLLLFSLFNSSDVFLLLKIKGAGYSDTITIGTYIFYNIVYAASSYPIGMLADRLGLKKVFLFGLLIFALVYFGMSVNTHLYVFGILFLLYGIYAAATEGVSKAWISNIVDKEHTATAIGTYTAFQSITMLLASSFTGLLWSVFGPATALATTAVATIFVMVYFLSIRTGNATNRV